MMVAVLRTLAFGVILFIAGPTFADDAKPVVDPARVAAARDLMEVTGVNKQLDGMIDAMAKGFSHGAQAETSEQGRKLSDDFQNTMTSFMHYKEDMLTDFAVLYAETFTAEEMKTVADFYRSGTGAKFIAMVPELMQKGTVIGLKYADKVVSDQKGADQPK